MDHMQNALFEEIASISAHGDVINSMDFSVDGKYLVTGSANGQVKIWEIGEKVTEKLNIEVERNIHSVSMAYHSYRVAVASDHKHVQLFDLEIEYIFLCLYKYLLD